MNYQFRLNCGLLRLFDEFDSLPDESAPGFQYEVSHPELERLREAYRIDQVAGGGDDWSKVLNAMQTGSHAYTSSVASFAQAPN